MSAPGIATPDLYGRSVTKHERLEVGVREMQCRRDNVASDVAQIDRSVLRHLCLGRRGKSAVVH